MNMYNAIMKAADHIECNPETYNFLCPRLINVDGGPVKAGCVLYWIHHYSGVRSVKCGGELTDSMSLFGIEEKEFFNRLDVVYGKFDSSWNSYAKACANSLRLYAQKYHQPDNVVRMDDYRRAAGKPRDPLDVLTPDDLRTWRK